MFLCFADVCSDRNAEAVQVTQLTVNNPTDATAAPPTVEAGKLMTVGMLAWFPDDYFRMRWLKTWQAMHNVCSETRQTIVVDLASKTHFTTNFDKNTRLISNRIPLDN